MDMTQSIRAGDGNAAKPCLVAGDCKHGAWCSDVYCQERCQFVKGTGALDALAELCDMATGGWDLPPSAVCRIGALARKARAAMLAAAPAAAPAEPTDAMVDAGKRALHKCDQKGAREKVIRIFKAMQEAAVQAPPLEMPMADPIHALLPIAWRAGAEHKAWVARNEARKAMKDWLWRIGFERGERPAESDLEPEDWAEWQALVSAASATQRKLNTARVATRRAVARATAIQAPGATQTTNKDHP